MKYIARLAVSAALVVAALAPVTPANAWYSYQRCTKYEPLYVKHTPRGGWDVRRMSYISWRESRCVPTIVNSTGGDTGLFQIHPVAWPWVSARFGVPAATVQAWLKVPENNVRVASALCTYWRRAGRGCYWAWVVR